VPLILTFVLALLLLAPYGYGGTVLFLPLVVLVIYLLF
jgi:hypothetical protein